MASRCVAARWLVAVGGGGKTSMAYGEKSIENQRKRSYQRHNVSIVKDERLSKSAAKKHINKHEKKNGIAWQQ